MDVAILAKFQQRSLHQIRTNIDSLGQKRKMLLNQRIAEADQCHLAIRDLLRTPIYRKSSTVESVVNSYYHSV